MEHQLLSRTQKETVTILDHQDMENGKPERWLIRFELGYDCALTCWIDFGLSGTDLYIEDIQATRFRPETLERLGRFLGHKEWFKSLVEISRLSISMAKYRAEA